MIIYFLVIEPVCISVPTPVSWKCILFKGQEHLYPGAVNKTRFRIPKGNIIISKMGKERLIGVLGKENQQDR